MKRKIFFFLIPLILLSGDLSADEQLARVIAQKSWTELAALCGDESHRAVEKYFAGSSSTKFVTYNINKLTYKAKFKNHAEIGAITYAKSEGRYRDLQIKNQIRPLYFIENFRKYPVKGRSIKVGEAAIYLREGHLYRSEPFGQVILFNGDWQFTINPSDEEERATLRHRFKSEGFSLASPWAIFILKDKNFAAALDSVGLVEKGSSEVSDLLAIYRRYFGIQIQQFNEHWYLPFRQDDNLVIFRKDKEDFYLYDFNATLSPDTILRTSPENKIILSYNSIRSAKLFLKEVDKIEKINLNLFYNPDSNFISGTVHLAFENPSPFKVLNLARGLKIKANLDQEVKGLSVVRKEKVYYFLGPPTHTLSLFYSGIIDPDIEYNDIFKRQVARVETTGMDNFFYLSRTQNFYPNSTIDFSEIDVSISVDKRFNCLASGQLKEVNPGDRNSFKFSSSGAKGISVVCGGFELADKIEAKVPINIYSAHFTDKARHFRIDTGSDSAKRDRAALDKLGRHFDFKKLAGAWDFMLERYGGLDLSDVNLLIKGGLQEGGLSEKGLIVFSFNPDTALSKQISRTSPIVLSSDPTDHLIHELAHQWWGGLVSWKSYRDLWLTEGLAQFSVIFWLEKHLSTKRFDKILKKMKRWIYRKNDSGPVIYGQRIISIDDDYEAYQSIVYNKSAFIFLMLKDLLGEKDFLERLRHILATFKYRSMNSAVFIKAFSESTDNNRELVARFLRNWLYSRKIPAARFYSTIKGKKAHLLVEQEEDVVFPLIIEIKSAKGSSSRTLVVAKKRQFFDIEEDSLIKSIAADDSRSLVKIERR